MRPPSRALLLLAAPVVLCAPLLLTGLPAEAQTAPPPSPSPSPSLDPTPSPASTPEPTASTVAVPPQVLLRDRDHEATVTLVPGQALRVELGPAADPWQGLEQTGPVLQLLGHVAGRDGLGASFEALSAGGPLRLAATAGDRRWSATVVVEGAGTRPPRTCAPAPTASGTPGATATATAVPTSSPRPGRPLSIGDDGMRYDVEVGDLVTVRLDSCAAPYGPVTADGPLRRDTSGLSVLRGEADGSLTPVGAGTATVRALRDAPCTSRPAASCPTPWTVVLDVRTPAPPAPEPCALTLTGPARVVTGATAALTGSAEPGESVAVLFRRRGETAFTVRRTLVAGPDGSFATSYAAVDDHRWYAASARCTSLPGLTQVLPDIAGPALVRRGTPVRLSARAAAGSRVAVAFRRAGSTVWRTGRTGTADAAGRFTTTFRPDVDHAYRVTSLGRTSTARITQAR